MILYDEFKEQFDDNAALVKTEETDAFFALCAKLEADGYRPFDDDNFAEQPSIYEHALYYVNEDYDFLGPSSSEENEIVEYRFPDHKTVYHADEIVLGKVNRIMSEEEKNAAMQMLF